MEICIDLNELPQILQIEIKAIKKKYALADFPPRFVNSVIKDFDTKTKAC